MSQTSSNLELPYLQAAQAQKHVTHNAALERLDLIAQLSVQGFDAETPPLTPLDGQVWALGAAPSGVWGGQAGKLAGWANGGWLFITPRTGWRAASGAQLRIWNGAGWVALGLPDMQNLPGVGINTTSDSTNRLAVASDAVLFNHAGAGHQVKVNKAAAGETASLLFQTGWSGRAEMGTAGDDNFSIKVSADGASWLSALTINRISGVVSMPFGLSAPGLGGGGGSGDMLAATYDPGGIAANAFARANHTGTQAASTITGLAGIATSGSASDLGAGTLPAARFDDTAHGTRAGGTLHAVATGSTAGFLSASDKTKLDGIATGATANSADATLLARANHTGTQAIATVSGLQAALDAKAPSASPTLTGDIFANGRVRAAAVAVSALEIDCSAGNSFTKSISANSTFTFSNVPTGAFAFTLRLTVSGDRTVTWPASVRWPGGTAPVLTASRTHLFVLATDDGGTNWRGAALVDYAG